KIKNYLNASICLNNLGISYYYLKNLDQAEKKLLQSINYIAEIMASLDIRLQVDLLSAQYSAYHLLIYLYLENNQPEQAIKVLEQNSAGYLRKKLQNVNHLQSSVPDIKAIQKQLDQNTALLYYVNLSHKILITHNQVKMVKNHLNKIPISLVISNHSDITQRGLKRKKNPEKELLKLQMSPTLTEMIFYLRNQILALEPTSELIQVSKELYKTLIADFQNHLKTIDRLIIIPGHTFAYLPFEALITEDNQYLVELYDIQYIQSFTIFDMLKSRDYSQFKRESMLAVGGTIFETWNKDISQINFDEMTYQQFINHNQVYQYLGYGQWPFLPGTQNEVYQLKKIYPKSWIISGDKANEGGIKSYSKKGLLKKYRFLHFATHGLVLPDFPELSSLVLSHNDNDQENGYLQVHEIAELKIQADCVTLSACETGLGKLYSGEGMLGLTQSFFIAGAAGLNVSLWPVADLSTMEYMTALYQLVEQKNLKIYQANSEIKRKFILGEIADGQFQHPYYWAPFVYYGK
ncbi:MAG: CHAT domain-containing protein, partial [Spirochaetes bacterium]|nr:CHAT domain-containing protein [Spirochaetota bacterium]